MQDVQNIVKGFTAGCGAVVLSATLASGLDAQVGSRPATPDPTPARVMDTGALVVLNGGAPEALLLDPTRNQVLARFATGPDPRDVAISPNGRYAYVTSYAWVPGAPPPKQKPNQMGGMVGPNTPTLERAITVVDLERRQVHAIFQPGAYRNLGDIVVGSMGERMWMTSDSEGGVVEVNAATGEVTMLWKTATPDAGMLAVSEDTRRVFVTHPETDAVTVIDRVTVVPTRVATGRRPTGLALTPNGYELWVTNSGDNTISVVKTRRPREAERLASGGIEPVHISFHAERGEAWVSHRGSRTVTVLEVSSGAVLADIEVPGEPDAITFSADGHHAYVASPGASRVFAIDVGTRMVTETLDSGSRSRGLAWSQHGGF
jgi:DNA-binding beta-propeller fold protein YncE